jgi:hypothetical protein
MKRSYFACLFLCLTTFLLSQSNRVPQINQAARAASPISAAQSDPKAQDRILDNYGKLPLIFEANHGQTNARVRFLSRTGGYSLFLTGDEAVFALNGKKASPNKSRIAGAAHALPSSTTAPKSGGVLRMKLLNANPAAKVMGVDEEAGTSNYFIGNDPAKWRTNVPTYQKVKYEQIYSGIDLVYYGNQRQLEYDFIVAPGADPHSISFEVRGASRIHQQGNGDLVFKAGGDEIHWHQPVVYQEKDGMRQEIVAHYAITSTNRLGFELAKYDASRPLYIDPLIYSTFLGGSNYLDSGRSIAVDSEGNAYVTGSTTSAEFPTTTNAFQTNFESQNEDAFVTKINPDGSALVYSTYLGNGTWNWGSGIAVDGSGNAYVVGGTFSPDFPTTPGAFQTTCTSDDGQCVNGNAFVTVLNPTGSGLVYSTYLGDTGGTVDQSFGIALGSGNAYVAGSAFSNAFPTTSGAFQTVCTGCNSQTSNAFVSKLNASGAALVYSTFIGGGGGSGGPGIAVNSVGNAYVVGYAGTGFPTSPSAFQTSLGQSATGAFVTEFNPSGSSLIYSTYLGGTVGYGLSAEGSGIVVDGEGYAYVTGLTDSDDFPTTPGAFQTEFTGTHCCAFNAFVTKFNPTGSGLVYSTYLGGSGGAQANSIAIDSFGNAYVTGLAGAYFPTENSLQDRLAKYSGFVTKLNLTGTALVYSTYLGGNGGGQAGDTGNGIALGSAGNVYVTGVTWPTDFPVTAGAFQTTCSANNCPFVAKINIKATSATALSSSPDPSAYDEMVTFTATIGSNDGVPPNGEMVSFMKGKTVLGTEALSGGSASIAIASLPVGASTIQAFYGGDANFAGSTSSVKQEVDKATTTTTLGSSANPSNLGQSVTFTANATPQFSGAVKGTVSFYDGTTLLKTMGLSGGMANCTTKTLTHGTHTITTTYNGNTIFDGSSSAPLTQTVN